MKSFALLWSLAASLLFAAHVYAAEATSGNAPPSAAPGASPAAPTVTVPQAPVSTAAPPTCDSVSNFFLTKCPLTWYGVTLYGTLDMGVTWQNHGAPLNRSASVGVEYLISKSSNRSGFHPAPNVLSQSVLGIEGNEELVPGWAFIFALEAGFDPYSLRFANGPGSVAQNAGVPLTSQSTSADSSRAGQFYNSAGYLGVTSPTYGTLTLFRQNALTLDGVIAYDPLGASYAFSPLGYQGTTCGGNTQDCRFTTALKYRVSVGQLRAAAVWQFGGYNQNNAANGAYQFQAGGDIPDVAGGVVSFDVIYSHMKDAVAESLAGNTLPAVLPQVLTATLSDNTAWMPLAKYTHKPVTLYGGYKWQDYANPSDPRTSFTDIAGNTLCLGCAALNNTNIVNTTFAAHDKIEQIFWVGANYALTDDIDVMAGYYEYLQNSFGAGAPCSNATKSTCSGMFNAISLAIDWRLAAKLDAYAGLMYNTVSAGLANGFLHHDTIDPTVGFRFRF